MQSGKKILSINKQRLPPAECLRLLSMRTPQDRTLLMLTIGNNAPKLTIPTDDGHFSIAEQGGKNVVIFFFPRADTSGCTKEAIRFSELLDDFTEANTIVIGVSKDSVTKQAKFRAKHGLTCLLGADEHTDMCEQFGVWVEKSMYGKRYMGIQRATFLLDPNGNIAKVWPKVKVDGHADAVLDAVKAL